MAEIEEYRSRFQDQAKAEKYATRFERGGRRRINEREQRAVRAVFAKLADCRTVLDVPSGAGRFLAALRDGGRRVVEADVAWEILDFARQRAKAAGLPAGFMQADASRLPLGVGAVDCIFSNRLLHHIVRREQREVLLREFHRVSRGVLVVSFFNYHSFKTARRVLKALKGRRPQYASQPSAEQFREEVAACGWRVREVVPTGLPWVTQQYWVLDKV